ncbi:MAG: CARDB domain-containing protein [Candidatus Bathyarchaeota archaeon]
MKMEKVLVKQTSRGICKYALLALLLLSSAYMVYGQGYEEWSKDIGGEDTEHFKAIQETTDGGFIIVGYVELWTRDDRELYMVKTDSMGDIEWSQVYGDVKDDDAYDVVQTSDGGYLVAGGTKSYGAGLTDLWVMRTDGQGELLWEKILGGAKDDVAYSITSLAGGDYLLAGSTASYGSGSSDVWVLKINDEGEVLWNITLGGPKNDIGREIITTADDGFIIVGDTSSYGAGWSDVWLIKMNADGSVSWNQTYGGSANDSGRSVKETSEGYVIAGNSDSFGSNLVEGYIVKADAEGNLVWEKTFGGSSDDYAESVELLADEGYLVTGYTTSTGTGESDVWLFSLSGDGDLVDETFYGGSMRDRMYQVHATSDGGYILVGFTWSFGSGGNGYLIKITMEQPKKPAEFKLSNLAVSPTTVETGKTVTVSVTVTNVGEETGSHKAELLLDGSKVDEETVSLEGGASETVEFTGVSGGEGAHTVAVGSLSGSFTVSAPPRQDGIPGYPVASLILGLSVTALALLYKRTH